MKYAFKPTITYTGKGELHPELAEIIAGLCHDEWIVSPQKLKRKKDEEVEDAAARYVRREFEEAAKLSGYKRNTKPFKVEIGMVVRDMTDESVARGEGFGFMMGPKIYPRSSS